MQSFATYEFKTEEIKQQLILSCLNFDAKKFLPYLLKSNVLVKFPNKVRFYTCFKETLECAEAKAIGHLELKIEKEPWEKDKKILAYNFYDQAHQHPRINLQVKEEEENLILDVLPF